MRNTKRCALVVFFYPHPQKSPYKFLNLAAEMEGGKKAVEEEDLQEEEVWEMINAREGSNSSSKTMGNFNQCNLSSSSFAWHVGGGAPRVSRHHRSAPVDIPGLSKIKKRSKRSDFDTRVDEDGDEEGEVGPPHEVLAKRLERTRIIASHSMCEGVGRTLKGRDLSKTRNAILTKTGFIEWITKTYVS